MPVSHPSSEFKNSFLSELAGSAGNFGILLPLLFGISIATGMNLSLMLLWAAAWYIMSGVYYRIPVPVEPLKVVGAIAIADHLAPTVIAASGILTGCICLLIGVFGCMDRIQKKIPESVIRGVQLGLALILVKSAISDFIMPDLFFAAVSAGIVLLFLLFRRGYRIPDFSALCIIIFGFFLAFFRVGVPGSFAIPVPGLVIPNPADFIAAGIFLVPPQLPLTLTNAILATSLLITDLFDRKVNPDRLSRTIGLMSISSSLFGGFPMCHGAGGLAAHFRFGARKGLSLVLGGVLLLLIALICMDPDIIQSLPKGIFGVLLIVVAIELGSHGLKTENRVVTGIIAVITVPFGLAVAFFLGLMVAWGITYHTKQEQNP